MKYYLIKGIKRFSYESAAVYFDEEKQYYGFIWRDKKSDPRRVCCNGRPLLAVSSWLQNINYKHTITYDIKDVKCFIFKESL